MAACYNKGALLVENVFLDSLMLLEHWLEVTSALKGGLTLQLCVVNEVGLKKVSKVRHVNVKVVNFSRECFQLVSNVGVAPSPPRRSIEA